MKTNDWKDRLGVIYSTNPDFGYDTGEEEEEETLPKDKQVLRISIEKHGRAGKVVTLVRGFVGTKADLEALGKLLKTRCGTGGSAKDGEIVIQGERREQLINLLKAEGYVKTK